MFSQQDVRNALNDNSPPEASHKVKYQDNGPADLDIWMKVGGRDKCWRDVVPNGSKKTNKKIIFCAPDLAPVSPVFLAILPAIINHYDILLWEGEGMSLTYALPIASPVEFWERLGKVIPASSEKVREGMGKQRLSAENYMIFDHAAFEAFLARCGHLFYSRPEFDKAHIEALKSHQADFLNLTYTDASQYEMIFAAIDPLQITRVRMLAPTLAEVEELKRRLPCVKTFEICNVSNAWVAEHLSACNSLGNIAFIDSLSPNKKITIPANVVLDSLTINSKSPNISFAAGTQIRRLIFNNSQQYIQIDLSNLRGCEEIIANDAWGVCLSNVDGNRIKSLELNNINYPRYLGDLAAFNHLKRLKISSPNLNEIQFSSQSQRENCFPDCGRTLLHMDIPDTIEKSLEILELTGKCCISDTCTHRLDHFSECEKLTTVVIDEALQSKILLPSHVRVETPAPITLTPPLQEIARYNTWTWTIEGKGILHEVSGENPLLIQQLKMLDLRYYIETPIYDLTACKELDTIDWQYSSSFKATHLICNDLSKLRTMLIRTPRIDHSLKIDLSGCGSLINLHIKVTDGQPVTIDLTHCKKLASLIIDMPEQIVTILHAQDCQLLRNVSIICRNATNVITNDLIDLPKETSVYYYETKGPVENLLPALTPVEPQATPAEETNQPLDPHFLQRICTPRVAVGTLILFYLLIGAGVFMLIREGMKFTSGSDQDKDEDAINWYAFMIVATAFVPTGLIIFLMWLFQDKLHECLSALCADKENLVDIEGQKLPRQIIQYSVQEIKVKGIETSIYSDGEDDQTLHRVKILDQVAWKDGAIKYLSGETTSRPITVQTVSLTKHSRKIEDVMRSINHHKNGQLISIEGPLQKNILYPLTSIHALRHPDDVEKIYVDSPHKINIFWNKEKFQFYFSVSNDGWSGLFSNHVRFYVHLKLNPKYEQKLIQANSTERTLPVYDPNALLPTEFIELLNIGLVNHAALSFMQDSRLELSVKLNRLFEYCRNFTIDLDMRSTTDGNSENILTNILNATGSSWERSEAFMLLARYLGIKVCIVENYRGFFCEITYIDDRGEYAARVGLGGISRVKQPSKFAKFENNIKQIEMQEIANNAQKLAEQKAYQAYYQQIKNAVTPQALHDFETLLTQHGKSFQPLITLLPGVNAFQVNAAVISALQQRGVDTIKRHLFINNYHDFRYYFAPEQFVTKDELVQAPTSPLKSLCENPELTFLVIDWSKFTPKQIGSVQSLIDTNAPTLTISKATIAIQNVMVIGVMDAASMPSEMFKSRSRPYQLHIDFLRTQPRYHTQLVEQLTPLRVDLFHNPTWRVRLFGTLQIHRFGVQLEEKGKLLQAINEKRPLIIVNPPENDDDFDLLVHQINQERKLLFNGNWLVIPEQMQVILQKADNVKALANVMVFADDQYAAASQRHRLRRIHLGIQNLHSCYKELAISPDGKPKTLPGGMLKEFNPESDIFYVVGKIPLTYWQELLFEIKTKYSDKLFKFELAPGAVIEDIASNLDIAETVGIDSHPAASVATDLHIIASNDPNYFMQKLKKLNNKLLPIYINPNTTFNKLIATITEDAEGKFIFKPQGVLQELSLEREVVLCGEISLALYYQLLPLLSSKPHIFLNGQWINVPGKLRLVVPKKCMEYLPIVEGLCEYSVEDYRLALNPLHPNNDEWITKIQTLYAWIQKMPHRGVGRPEKPELYYHHLVLMLNKLNQKHPLHPHNPIKGLINYRYPNDERAYVNVLGKYIFRSQDKKAARGEKIDALFIKHRFYSAADIKDHVWKLLNCFSGAELHDILGESLNAAIQTDGYPTLRPFYLEKIWQVCVEKRPIKTKPFNHSRYEKQQEHLFTLLDDPQARSIFLLGPPGVSKTYSMRYQMPRPSKEGKAGRKAWLARQPVRGADVYLIDEINQRLPGKKDGLIKGHVLDQSIYDQAKEHPTAPNQKLVGTGNPESFHGRYFHESLMYLSETIYFQKPDDVFLNRYILKGFEFSPHLDRFKTDLLAAYHLIEKYNPHYVTSLRDMNSLIMRFKCIARHIDKSDSTGLKLACYKACMGEFAGGIQNIAKRAAFSKHLQEQIGLAQEQLPDSLDMFIPIAGDVVLTNDKRYLVEAIEQDLEMRLEAMFDLALRKQNKLEHSAPHYELKQTLQIEGKSGTGKSTFLRAMIELHKKRCARMLKNLQTEIKEAATPILREEMQIKIDILRAEVDRQVLILTMGAASPAMLSEAYQKEWFVIGEESNLDPEIEKTLKGLYNSMDENGHYICKPGFQFYGSRNASSSAGRADDNDAAFNRARFLYFDDCPTEAYIAYAKRDGVPYAEQFVQAFQQVCKEIPETNKRNFHHQTVIAAAKMALVEAASKGVVESGVSMWVKRNTEEAGSEKEPLLKLIT